MATTSLNLSPFAADPDIAAQFQYGWRLVTQRLPDGTLRTEQVPLTLEEAH